MPSSCAGWPGRLKRPSPNLNQPTDPTMDDLPDQTDPPAMRGRFVMDRDGDVWQLIYGQTFLWRCLTTESTDQMGGDLLNVCGPLIDLVPADEIESLRVRLAQAEDHAEGLALANGKALARAAEYLGDARRAEAALARVSRLCDAAIDRRKRLSSADGYNEISLRGAADLATNVLAALVVADTGEGLSKTSAKPLVVADTPKEKAHQEGQDAPADLRRVDGCACGHTCEHGPHEADLDHVIEPICYGCPHCGCDPADPKDFCRSCESCDTPEQEQR